MKKAIVFGGSGFLGSYVADELAVRGYQTVIADVKPPKVLEQGQKFVPCDILDGPRVCSLVTKDVCAVYNFAGLADINDAIHLPVRTVELNVLGNLHILEACKGKCIERFVYASSAYAFSKKGSFYGISKHASEKLIEEYWERFGLKYSIVRYGSLYGERADEHNYIYCLLLSALKHNQITLLGDPEDIREYIHAKDAAKLSVDILQDPGYENSHLILTGFEKLKRRELFNMVAEILHDQVAINYSHVPHEGHYRVTPYSFHPKVARKLIANPFIDMGQGLVECIRHIYSDLHEEVVEEACEE